MLGYSYYLILLILVKVRSVKRMNSNEKLEFFLNLFVC